MAKLIGAANISDAWVQAMEYLVACGGKASNLIAAIAPGGEVSAVRAIFDEFLQARESNRIRRIRKVADTIFPVDFYRAGPGDAARDHLYRMQKLATKVERRFIRGGTYFDRLIDWPGGTGAESELERNQLERRIRRMKSYWDSGTRNHSAYELAVSTATAVAADLDGTDCFEGGDLRVQDPLRDNFVIGFPCLSHISLTLFQGRLELTALYRNQHFITKAYGNFVGLSDLQRFVCQEVGCSKGELVCVATHADAELGTEGLVRACRKSLDSNGR
jgi:hypothetical protein